MRINKSLSLAVIAFTLLCSILTACGDSPTATPPATTAAATTAAAPATTAAATTAAAPATTAAATTAAATTAVATTVAPATTAAVATTVAPTAAATATPAPAASSAQPNIFPLDPTEKTEPDLLDVITKYNNAPGSPDDKLKAAIEYATEIDAIDESNELYFEIVLNQGADQKPVENTLKNLGATLEGIESAGGTKIALVTVQVKQFVTYSNPTNRFNFLAELGSLKEVAEINLPVDQKVQELNKFPASLDALVALAQTSKNQGVQIMGVDKWHAAGINGKGVTIGIIDSGYMFIDQLKGQGYLPNDFKVMDFAQKTLNENSLDNGVHGTAVSEIIYSVAPGAKMIATSIKGTSVEFSEAIDYLVDQKVDIISISMGNNSSSEDGNSPLSKKIEQVRKEKGILFFLAAGNEGTEHYGGKYTPDANGYHQFQPGTTRMAVGNPTGDALRTSLILRWDQFLDGGVNPNATDLDLIVEDASGKVIDTSDGDQRARTPNESMELKLPPNSLVYIRVRLKPGTPAPAKPFNLHVFVTGGLTPQFFTPTQTVGSQADSRGAIAVGAVDPAEGNEIGSYSSQGPLSDGRIKPEISGPAGVDSAAYGAKSGGAGKFPGTSAATPNVSAFTAVLKSSNPALTPDELTTVLFETAVKPAGVTTTGADPVFGYGKVSLVNVTPGPLKPKGTVQPPTPNNNPDFKYKNPSYLPAPAPDAASSTPPAPAVAPVPLDKIEADPTISVAIAKSLKAGTVTNVGYFVSSAGNEQVVANLEAALLARGYKFSLPNNSKPVTIGTSLVGLYTKQGETDILINAQTLPEDPSKVLTTEGLPGVGADVVEKFIGQVKGQKTLLYVLGGSDLSKNFGG